MDLFRRSYAAGINLVQCCIISKRKSLKGKDVFYVLRGKKRYIIAREQFLVDNMDFRNELIDHNDDDFSILAFSEK